MKPPAWDWRTGCECENIYTGTAARVVVSCVPKPTTNGNANINFHIVVVVVCRVVTEIKAKQICVHASHGCIGRIVCE